MALDKIVSLYCISDTDILPPWMIEEIEKEKRKQYDDRPQPQLPLYDPYSVPEKYRQPKEDKENRGVAIIDYSL